MTKTTTQRRMNFTMAAIAELPLPVDKPSIAYYDEQERKLMVLVQKGGTKSFYVSKKVKGRMRSIHVGTYPETTVFLARNNAKSALAAIARGEDPQESKRKYRKETTLGKFFDQYCCDTNKKSLADDKDTYRRYFSDWSNKKLSEISRSDIKQKHNFITKNNGPYSANRAHSLIRSLFNVAIDQEIFTSVNPAYNLARNHEISRTRHLEAHELRYFLNAIEADKDAVASKYFLLLLLTGIRRSEALSLKWQYVDFQKKELKLPTTKNGQPHNAVLSDAAIQVIKSIERESTIWLFPGSGKKGHFGDPSKAWKRILQRARLLQLVGALKKPLAWDSAKINSLNVTSSISIYEIIQNLNDLAHKHKIDISRTGFTDLRIHDLRRTLGSWQAMNGSSLSIIGKSLGHKSLAATAVYAHLSNNSVHESVNKTNATMLGMPAPEDMLPS
ncbi:MAG: tyrosine-type recombinase/integrase [Gammaproteobacteria bacterium]|nr:tyrosine-type recombinase/integrase [Gammaproteobacteria bacterium]